MMGVRFVIRSFIGSKGRMRGSGWRGLEEEKERARERRGEVLGREWGDCAIMGSSNENSRFYPSTSGIF
jgi:hypothetical protein